MYAVNTYLAHNTPINLYPDNIVNKLFELFGTEQTYEIINNYEFDHKNAWKFSFFKNLPFDAISEKAVQQLYDFLSENEGNITSSPYREIEFLDKYRQFDNDVFVKAGLIILSKHKYSPFMFSLYFYPMFSPYDDGTNLDILMDRFKNDFSLLKEIYLKLISYDKHIDNDGRYLIYFIKNQILFIDEFIEFTLKDENTLWNDEEKRLSVIWNCDKYIQYADHIFKAYYCNENLYNWQIAKYVGQLLMIGNNSETKIDRQDEWVSHFIEVNFNNTDFMKIIFSSISEVELSPERRKKHILHFIKLNSNPLLFDEIQLEPRGYGGVGSMIPYMEARISFLESLLPALNGLTYLKHKQRIERSIEAWRRSIEREQIDEVLRDI